jgi:glycerol-3-phosphate dehydrogenase (NAD(P)+)
MKAAVIPAGAWGTALALCLEANGFSVHLWCREREAAEEMARTRENRRLPGVSLPPSLLPTSDLEEVLHEAGVVVLAPPSGAFRSLLKALLPLLPPGALLLSGTKGLEPGTGLRMSQVAEETDPSLVRRLGVVSGPNFAGEIARRLPASTVVAARDPEVASFFQRVLSTPWFRVYTQDDVAGVELGGALKNVLAIGVGIAEGMGAGKNAQAALITRGLHELARLGVALGARERTFFGLAGLGDLVLTSTSSQSRNRQLGVALGRGESLSHFLFRTGFTVEGAVTAPSARTLAEERGLDLPIVREVALVLEGKSPREALRDLMSRELRAEF